jgi:hypothetical protein
MIRRGVWLLPVLLSVSTSDNVGIREKTHLGQLDELRGRNEEGHGGRGARGNRFGHLEHLTESHVAEVG